MSTKVVGVKLQSSGWCGSNRNRSGGEIVRNALLTPGARGERARADDGLVGDRMVGVERIGVGVRDDHVGLELADRLDDDLEPLAVDVERVVAEVERPELGAQRPRRLLGLGVTNLLHVLDRLALDLPQLARLAALAVGQREHLRDAAGAGRDGNGAARPPDEVRRVRADHQHAPAHAAPASSRELPTVIVRISSSEKPPSSSRSANSARPSSTGGFAGWPRSVESRLCSGPVARIPA